MTPSTMSDLFGAVQTDTGSLSTEQAAVQAAQQQLAADQTQLTADQQILASAVAQSGPFAVASADGASVNVVSASSDAPGYAVTNYPVGTAVPIPAPAPDPTPTSGS